MLKKGLMHSWHRKNIANLGPGFRTHLQFARRREKKIIKTQKPFSREKSLRSRILSPPPFPINSVEDQSGGEGGGSRKGLRTSTNLR